MIQAINNTNNIHYRTYDTDKKTNSLGTLKNFASLSYNMQNESFTSFPAVMIRNTVRETASVWHKYPLKLMVYSNDVGEAVRPLLGNLFAKLSLIPAVFYTGFALNAGKKKENLGKELLFQGIASFLMPFLLVKSTRAAASKAFDKMPDKFKQIVKDETAKIGFLDKLINKFKKGNSSGYKNVALTGISIGVLALSIKPIDEAVKKILDL